MGSWIGEVSSRFGFRFELWAERVIAESSSDCNPRIIIAETEQFGKVLVLGDGKDTALQYSDKWDFYEEMLAHVPLAAHPSPRKILIIGGGDGAVLREVLKHSDVEKVTLVEIDGRVVELCKKYLDHGHVFDDERAEIIIADGAEFITRGGLEFDVILGDYSDPYVGMSAEVLLSDQFYAGCKKALREGGIVALQAGSPVFQMEITKRTLAGLRTYFDLVDVYFSPVPIYPGGLWSYAVASLGPNIREPLRDVAETKFYNRAIHPYLFKLVKLRWA